MTEQDAEKNKAVEAGMATLPERHEDNWDKGQVENAIRAALASAGSREDGLREAAEMLVAFASEHHADISINLNQALSDLLQAIRSRIVTQPSPSKTRDEELARLVAAAKARAPMTDAERAAQRESWVRGEMALQYGRECAKAEREYIATQMQKGPDRMSPVWGKEIAAAIRALPDEQEGT